MAIQSNHNLIVVGRRSLADRDLVVFQMDDLRERLTSLLGNDFKMT